MIDHDATTTATISAVDIAAACGIDPGSVADDVAADAARQNLSYRPARAAEIEAWATMVLERMRLPRARRTAEENQQAFEQGWRENLELALAGGVSAESLRPRYFRPTPFLRYRRGLIVSGNEHLEYALFTLVRRLVFRRFLADCTAVREFGCGSCGNLLLLGEMFPQLRLHALDWARSSVEIASLLAKRTGLSLTGDTFDMRRPGAAEPLAADTAILTVHALEQLGGDFQPLIDHFLASRPCRVVHLEPIMELYDPDNLYDHLAVEYSRRRGYLEGYLPALERLAAEGRIEIIKAVRPGIGGVIHEASLVVWEPR